MDAEVRAAVSGPHQLNRGELPLTPYLGRLGSVLPESPAEQSLDDPLVQQAERAVRQLERSQGREYNDQSACMAASVACLAKSNGLTRIDHVLLSEERGTVRQGENLFVVQGELGDPAQRRAQMKTQDAASTPIEQSIAQLQALNDTPQRQPAQAMEGPGRETGPLQIRMS